MQPVTLTALKLHCKIDHDDEDAGLRAYLDAAIASVEQHLGITAPLDDTCAAPVKAAILLAAAGLYLQCGGISDWPLHGNLTYH